MHFYKRNLQKEIEVDLLKFNVPESISSNWYELYFELFFVVPGNPRFNDFNSTVTILMNSLRIFNSNSLTLWNVLINENACTYLKR